MRAHMLAMAFGVALAASHGQQTLEISHESLDPSYVLNPHVEAAPALTYMPKTFNKDIVVKTRREAGAEPNTTNPYPQGTTAMIPKPGQGKPLKVVESLEEYKKEKAAAPEEPAAFIEKEGSVPCFGKPGCTKFGVWMDKYAPDPENPNDWKKPEMWVRPKDEETIQIPAFNNTGPMCCGDNEDEAQKEYRSGEYFSDSNRSDKMGLMPPANQTGHNKGEYWVQAKHHKASPQPCVPCKPCRNCSPKRPQEFELPEPALPKEFTPEMVTKPTDIVLLEEEPGTKRTEPRGNLDLLDGDENNKMLFTPKKALASGAIAMGNMNYHPINHLDDKVMEVPEAHAELVEKLEPEPLKFNETIAPESVEDLKKKCEHCMDMHVGEFYKPEVVNKSYHPQEAAVVALEEGSTMKPVAVVALEIEAMSKAACECQCVSQATAMLASKEISGACPVCPPCESTSKFDMKVDCAKAAEGLKRPKCNPIPGTPVALHKYRTIQKALTIIPEITTKKLLPPENL